MTNVSNEKQQKQATTLDKIWKRLKTVDEDIDMKDTEEKESTNLMDHSKNGGNETNKETTPYDDYTATKEMFPMALRFKISSNTEEDAHKKHLNVLQAIAKNMKHCEIYSRMNRKVQMENIAQDSFEYHEIGNRNKHFIVVHRIVLDMKYHEIKLNKTILETLKHNKCFVQNHMWRIVDWNIISVGFISGASPKHQSKDSVMHKLESIEKTELQYYLRATTLNVTSHGTKHSTTAYEVQCKKEEMDNVCNYVSNTCKQIGQTFIKYKWKHTSELTFINGIHKQNSFIQKIRTIPIYGIIPDAMSYMYKKLMEDNNIIEIGATNKTTTMGRWNVYTTEESFEQTTKWLMRDLKTIYNEHCKHDKQDVPTSYEPEVRFSTEITFNSKPDPLLKDADLSVSTYNKSPTNTWASIASHSKATSSITSPSNLSNTIQKLNDSISRICDRLDKIEKTLATHGETISRFQQFENESTNHFNRLSEILLQLEERTNAIKPRKLDYTFEQLESSKRRDIRSTPTKRQPRM